MPSLEVPSERAVTASRKRPWPRIPGWLRHPRWPRIRASIGLRLALLALALGLPFVVYVGGNAAVQAAHEREEAKQRSLALARLFALRIDDYVSDMAGALALVGYGVTMDAAATRANDAFLRRIRPDLPRSVNNVGIWTLDGRNIGTLERARVRGDANVGDREFFRRALASGTLVVDGPLTSRSGREPIVVFARPVLAADRRPLGVVTVSARLRDLGWLLDLKGAMPPDTVVSIVNGDGVVLARNVDADRWIGTSVKDIGRASAHLASREGVDETRGADNVERIAGFTVAERAGWHVFVGAPADAALYAARANFIDMLLYGTLSLLFGALFAARLGGRIARPLRTLARDAMLFARGNLAHRTSVGGDDETGVLAATFNRMAQALEDRTKALHDKTAALEAKTQALTGSEQRLRSVTDNIPSMIAYIDRDHRYRFNSRYYESWLGRPLAEITGRHLRDVMGADAYEEVARNLDRAFRGERVDFDVEVRNDAGDSRFVRGTYIPDFDADRQVIGVYSSSTDVTPLKKIEQKLERLAQHDALTGLPNRHTFNDAIATALARSQRTGLQLALLFLDVDGFKQINDTLGHAAGDDVLREFAQRLKDAVRPTDFVARLAGDEFVIVLEGIHTRDECRLVARKVIAAMRGDFRAGDAAVRVTTSIGIALGHGEASTAEALLKRADSALYAAKGQGRDRFELAI